MRKPILSDDVELVTVPVKLSCAQLRYLQRFAYFLRTTPEDLLVALTFSAIEGSDGMGDDALLHFMRDLLNWVDERRVPAGTCDINKASDSGQFTSDTLKARRGEANVEEVRYASGV